MVQYLWVLEMLDQAWQTLEPCISQHTNLKSINFYLIGSEFHPLFVVEPFVEFWENFKALEINETVTNVTIVLRLKEKVP